MKHPFSPRGSRVLVSVAVLATAALAGAQPAVEQFSDWKAANDAVGQFQRGHADLLKWEAANGAQVPQEAAAAGFPVPSLEVATRLAWRPHLDLQKVLPRLGQANAERIAQGRWHEVDARHQRRIDGVNEVFEVAAEARRAWLRAVAARQAVRLQRESLEAAEAATELGRRMVKVGNWSAYQQSRVELGLASERRALQQASVAARQAERALLHTLQLNGVHERLALPDTLPDLPRQTLTATELGAELAELKAQLSHAQQWKAEANFEQALASRDATLSVARGLRDDVMAQRNLLVDESVLQYNGMLKSVWDLLTEVQARAQSQRETVDAVRDYWLADTDLMWVLQGGEPTAFVVPGAASGEAPAAGH